MKRTRLAFTLAIASCSCIAAMAAEPEPSPLGMAPARVEYLANDAPFVVFDITPRRLSSDPAVNRSRQTVLAFMATDMLRYVNVAVTARSAQVGGRETAPVRVACGARIAGYHQCAIPSEAALAHLAGDDGTMELQIEAQGLDNDRSVVRIALPVKARRIRPPAAVPAVPVIAPGLTFLAAPAARGGVVLQNSALK